MSVYTKIIGHIETKEVVTEIGDIITKVITERDANTREVINVTSEAMLISEHLNGKRWKNIISGINDS